MKKESLAQVFCCEFCEISKNTFFYKTPVVTASKSIIYRTAAVIESMEEVFYKKVILQLG